MNRFTFLILAVALALPGACASVPRKTQALKQSAEEILRHLGYKDFVVVVVAHTNYRPPLTSIETMRENFRGFKDDPLVKGPKGTQPQLPPGYDGPPHKHSTYRAHHVTATYDSTDSQAIREYLDYISIVIIFPKIAREKREALADLLLKVLANRRRPDSLLVVSRREVVGP